jgi:drug/metabolite transporter (DMT)-like permease
VTADERRGIALLFLSAMSFAVMAVSVRMAAVGMSPTQVACLRFAGSFVMLRALAGRGRLRPQPGNLPKILQRGLLGALAIVCYFAAIGRIGAGFATLLHCTYPVWTSIFAVLFLGERASWRLGAAIALDLVGLALVVGPAADLGGAGTAGVVVAVIGSVLAGGAVATAKSLRGSETSLLITVYFMAVGVVVTAPSLLAGFAPLTASHATVLLVVVVTSAAGQWLLHEGLGHTSATLGSLIATSGVVATGLLEAVLFGALFGWVAILGAGLMIAAVGLAAGASRMPTAVRAAA